MLTFLLFYITVAIVVANLSAIFQGCARGEIEDAFVVRMSCLWPVLILCGVILAFGVVATGVELGYRLLKARFQRA